MYKSKRLLAMLLAVLMLTALFPAGIAFAEEPSAEVEQQSRAPETEPQQEEPEKQPQQEDSEEPQQQEPVEEPKAEESNPRELLTATPVVYVNYGKSNQKGFSSLDEALGDSSVVKNSVLTLTGDLEISSRIVLGTSTGNYQKNNITLKDDGTPRTIYFSNTASGTVNSRGIQLNSGYKFSITGTSPGGITVSGTSQDGATASTGNLLYAYSGSFTLTNVVFKDYSVSTGAVYISSFNAANKLSLNTCSFSGNLKQSGKDVYIDKDTSLELTGSNTIPRLYSELSSPISITGSLQGSAICLELPEEKLCEGTRIFSGTASNLAAAISATALSGLSGDLSILADGTIGRLYTITAGQAATGDSLSYSFPNATVSAAEGETFSALSVYVNTGKISADWSVLGAMSISSSRYVTDDGEYGSSSGLPSTGELRAFSLVGGWTAAKAQTLIRSLIMSVDTSGMTQTISIGLCRELSDGAVYLAGGSYSYVSGSFDYSHAQNAAINAGGKLAAVTDRNVSLVLNKTFGSEGWLGAQLLSDNWYWVGGTEDGTRITLKPGNSTGYNGIFTNWADGQPGDGSCMALVGGKWYTRDELETRGYYLEIDDGNSISLSTTVSTSTKKLALTSLSLTLDEGLKINYYLSFTEAFAQSEGAKVVVTLGETEQEFIVSDVICEENKSAHSDSYRVSVPCSAKDMNSEVVIRFISPEGRCLGTIGGEGKTRYNVRWYAENIILKKNTGDSYNSSYSSELINLVKALLNYGAATQTQFGVEGTLANSGYEDSSAVTNPLDIDSAIVSYSSGVKFRVDLIADSKTLMRIRPVTSSSFKATVDGAEHQVSQDSAGCYFDIEIPLNSLTRVFEISLSEGYSGTINLNTVAVIKAILNNAASEENAITTADMLYKLALRSGEYFGSYIPSAGCTESVLNTAYAYLAKSQYTQYDQKQLQDTGYYYKGETNSRRQITASPQSATDQNDIYLDCSSFVYNVYREVFGEEKVLAALDLDSTDDIQTSKMKECKTASLVASYDTGDTASINQLKSDLQPGDLIVKYRNAKTGVSAHGHVVLWTGNGYIHSTGASYDYDAATDKTEEKGAVLYVPSADVTAEFYEGFDELVLLRPLNMLCADEISTEGTGRRQLGAMAVSKLAYCGNTALYSGISVVKNSTVTYVIRLENPKLDGAMTTSRTVTVTDQLPASGVSFTGFTGDYTGTSSGTKLTWTVTIAPGQTVELKYTVSVTASAGSTVPASTGTVVSAEAGETAGSISYSGLKLSVEKAVTESRNIVVERADSLTGTCSSAVGALNSVFSNIASLGTADNDWATSVFTITNKGSSKGYSVVNTSGTGIRSYLVSNFAGGKTVLSYTGDFSGVNRVRNVAVRNLMPGDIIAVCTVAFSSTDTSLSSVFYIYLDEDRMVYIESGEAYAIKSAATVMQSLLGADCFAVLRPCDK